MLFLTCRVGTFTDDDVTDTDADSEDVNVDNDGGGNVMLKTMSNGVHDVEEGEHDQVLESHLKIVHDDI